MKKLVAILALSLSFSSSASSMKSFQDWVVNNNNNMQTKEIFTDGSQAYLFMNERSIMIGFDEEHMIGVDRKILSVKDYTIRVNGQAVKTELNREEGKNFFFIIKTPRGKDFIRSELKSKKQVVVEYDDSSFIFSALGFQKAYSYTHGI